MMLDVAHAIDRYMDAGPERLEKTLLVGGPDGPRLAQPLLAEIRADLHQRAADYREGWTSPRERPWRERNALSYAILLLLLGAGVGEGVKIASKAAMADQPVTSKLSKPKH